ncbi:conserved hypothetical protein [Leishmania braziliensis MHOM/BR/75/M2904]|uniref:GATOR2 complex protein MIO zinc-ribbon like domain-containing protein n=2 Tax=Leishmania braziliensis TaxID=5660 RepID=A4HE67_LEIBR|nr:conserved hypothetical protein [Leishmania braziliensis MHOM/BR/75/M2904]CAJ2474198.1 unnamed protein product [Leishmania braziliensis]CAM39120.2 conserved hypothetical protein [Leishmania braziliensis MHOM/BR/75/M2904]SYZ66538.1 hypothetical_protein [Leishmania braziliensis MHOM/BR/75/M2904]
MKHFACQPDTHNAFGSLTNGVLTYFTLDCTRYRRVAASSIDSAAELHTPAKKGDAAVGGKAPLQWTSQQLFTAPSSFASHGAGHGAVQQDVDFTTETRVRIQRTLILPSPFQATQCFFSMANRTLFGTDMAFIGAANGVLTLAVLQEDLLLYVRGKDPQSLHEQLQREQAASSSTPNKRSGLLASTATSDNGVVVRRPPSLSAISMTLPSPSQSGGGSSDPPSSSSFIGGAAAATMARRPSSLYHGMDPSFDVDRGPSRIDAPSTISWMRNKPLVLVGYTSGRVEWYEVSISAARREELQVPVKEIAYSASVKPGAFAYQAPNRDSHSSRVARVAVGGQMAGLRIELVASCVLMEAGALVSSDYFAVNSMVVVGSERGTLFLFDTDHLEAPLCEVRLSTPSMTFLYCHPFLPIVGVLSQSVWSRAEELPPRSTAASARRRRGNSPALRFADSHSSDVARPLVGPVNGGIGSYVGGPQRGVTSGKRCPATFPLVPLQGSRCDPDSSPQQLSSPSGATPSAVVQGTPKADRHVGWHDESPAALMSGGDVTGAFSSSSCAASPFGLYGSCGTVPEVGTPSALHSGCVLTFVEYRKDSPPRPLSRAGTGTPSPPPSHRLIQVLQHRMEGEAARYGTYYTFSWKFSFDLELAISNLEEGALRIVRAARIMDKDPGADVGGLADKEDREGTAADGEQGVSAPGANTAHPTAYQVLQNYNVRLPLHSLVNVEYVSAATSSLCAPDNAAADTDTELAAWSNGTSGTPAEQSLFRRDAEQCQRQAALLGAAVDPRFRLGFSSVSPSQVSPAAGVLCCPVNPLWAGLTVVSMPRGGRRHERCHSGDADRYVDQLDLFSTLRGCSDAFDALYFPVVTRGGDGTAGVIGGGRAGGSDADRGVLLLKENVLAASMLQPFCGNTGASDSMRHHRRCTVETGSCGGTHGSGADATSSRWPSSPTITSVFTPQPHPQRRREQPRRRHNPGAPNIPVPSYATKGTKNEIASAVLIAADQRADLHDALRIGPGNVSFVVVMNAAGEVASVPVEVRAVSAWHEAGSVFVGLGPTLYAADFVSIQGIEQLMRRRYAAGFGLSSLANITAVKEVGGFGSEDVGMLLSYVAILEAVPLVALSGPVPSLMALLNSSPVAGHGAVQREAAARLQARLGPAWRLMMKVCVCHGDLCCFLVLQLLRWLPSSLEEEAGQLWRSIVQLPHLSAATPMLGESSTNVDVERAVAVEVTHGHYLEAAELLLRFSSRSPSYGIVANLLRHPEEAQSMVCNSDPRVCASFRASLTPWLLVVFHCLCGSCDGAPRYQLHDAAAAEEGKHDRSTSVQSVLPLHLYRHSALPFWDRVALAVVMEAGTTAAFSHVMQDILLPECNPIQALLLQRGIHHHAYAAMQEIVDYTGDFQLGACLFARVGVLTTAAALAFPFLLDAEVSAAAATGRMVATSSAAHTLSLGLAGSSALSAVSPDYPLYSYGAGGDFGGYSDGDEGQGRDSVYGSSPFSYLRSGRRRRSLSQVPSPSSSNEQGSMEDGVAHTARLVRKSALPPPAQTPGEVKCDGRLHHSANAKCFSTCLSPGHALRCAVSPNDAVVGGGCGRGKGLGNAQEDNSDDADADVPWVWWAAAYRSFLDDEQAFVRRTTFDVECGQLRSRAFLARDATAATMEARHRAATPPSSAAALASVAGVAHGGRYRCGYHPFHRTAPRDAEVVGWRHSSPSPENLVSMSVAHCVGRHVAGASGDTSSGGGSAGGDRGLPTAASSSSPPARMSFAGPFGDGSAYVTAVTPPYASAFIRPPEPKLCVCGAQHVGTQLIRSLLSICSMTATRCTVCLETVQPCAKDVATAFAWCTSCGHGGHAYHLQNWFRTHRRCPVNGCDCHCDEDSSLY